MKKILYKFLAFTFLTSSFCSKIKADENKNKEIFGIIENFTEIMGKAWMKDKFLKTIRMPQTILLDANSRVYGSCSQRDKNLKTIGGSSYCSSTNTIFLVKEDVDLFYELNDSSGLLYLLAHEWSHSLQHAWLSKIPHPAKELQADCLAGRFVTMFEENIDRKKILSLAKISLHMGSKIHGTGNQRAYALLTGLGVIDGTCSIPKMKDLAKKPGNANKVISLMNLRSASNDININKSPHKKSFGELIEKFEY
ncbi:hypothetical protein N9V02_06850 [Prochlorococcus sp. AH-736-L23]|nr:hypothetical protein [Prochlorococcus sp. AH-736-L23]